jgi:hypothetical protein
MRGRVPPPGLQRDKGSTMKRLASASFGLALLLFGVGSSGPAKAQSIGSIATDTKQTVLDYQLERLIFSTIGQDYESMILAFTECYAGDKLDNFAVYSNSARLACNMPGFCCEYDGYHRGLAPALAPDTYTNDAHVAGIAHKGDTEVPQSEGDNIFVRGSDQTYVLVWAGQPSSAANGASDWDDIKDLHDNFDGESNTTVTVLAGNGTGENVDGPATFQQLTFTLKSYGDAMQGGDDQFILYVTDHGDLHGMKMNVNCPGGACSVYLDSPSYTDMINDPQNQPELSLFVLTPIDSSCALSVDINGESLVVPSTPIEMDYDYDGSPDEYQYLMRVVESLLHSTNNEVAFSYTISGSCPPLVFERVGLGTGAISRIWRVTTPALTKGGIAVLTLLVLTAGTVAILRGRAARPLG